MNRRVLIGIGVVIVAVAGWLGYRQMHPPGRTVGSLMPSGSLLMLASTRLQDTVSAQELRTEISLQQIPIFAEARQRLDRFLYATADTTTALAFIRGKNVRYSLHPITKTTLDYIVYIPISDATADQAYLNKLTNPDPRYHRVLNHTFHNEKIFDLVSRAGEQLGSFILTDNFVVVSTSGILIENVAERLHQSIKLPRTEPVVQVDADHWAGLTMRPDLLQSLFENTGSLVRLFLPEAINLQFRSSGSHTHLIGYASDEIGSRQDVADLFAGQTPRRIQSAPLIPQTTATIYHIGLSDPVRFGRSMSHLLSAASGDFLRARFDQIKSAVAPVYASLGSDVMLCRLESSGGSDARVLVLNTSSPKALKTLSAAWQQVAFQAGARQTPPPVDFLGHKLLRLDVAELPASLFSSLFSGFRQSWITEHGNALIVANGEDVMQDYLQQVQRGLVWANDSRQTDLLSNTLRPANFTALLRLNRQANGQQTVMMNWPLAWQNLFDSQSTDGLNSSFDNLETMAYQASYGNENILSTVVLGRTTRRASQAVLNRVLLQKKIDLDEPLLAAPIATGSFSQGSAQFFAQTGNNQLIFVSPYGDKIGPVSTDGPIRSNTLPVDFLNNGRLQYLFMTERSLYVADPAPRKILLTRIPLPTGLNATYLTRPRGATQRNWIALATHADGSIYALDRQRKAFVRIIASKQKAPLLLPVQVQATANGMTVLAAQADGTVQYWQENGNPFPNFPVRIQRKSEEAAETRLAGPALLPAGQPAIQLVTEEGELMQLSPAGQVQKRVQLYRPVRSGVFRLFPDESLTNWLLLRTTDTEAAILNQKGEQQFDVRALQPDNTVVRYHRLGASINVVSVKSGGFTTLYDLTGRIIGDRPIPGDFPVALQFDAQTNELYILSGSQKAVQLFSIRMR